MHYAEVAEVVFLRSKYGIINKLAKTARYVTSFFVLGNQLGFCIVYIVFSAKIIKELMDIYWPEVNYITSTHYHIIVTLLLIPYCFITTLYFLSHFMIVANILTIICVVIIFQYILTNTLPVENLNTVTTIPNFFIFFGTAMFSFSSISSILPLRREMRVPSAFDRWNGILTFGMVIVMVLYTATGFYGYLAFGAESKVILRNLPEHW